MARTGIVSSYGWHWRRDLFKAPRHRYYLVGRIGNGKRTKVANFSEQDGIYSLYLHRRLTYVGIAVHRSLSDRLQVHCHDSHQDDWDEFTWFGFRPVRPVAGTRGYHELTESGPYKGVGAKDVIMDLEGVLHRISEQRPRAHLKSASEWFQASPDDIKRIRDRSLERLSGT
jgi:hypothetical protein